MHTRTLSRPPDLSVPTPHHKPRCQQVRHIRPAAVITRQPVSLATVSHAHCLHQLCPRLRSLVVQDVQQLGMARPEVARPASPFHVATVGHCPQLRHAVESRSRQLLPRPLADLVPVSLAVPIAFQSQLPSQIDHAPPVDRAVRVNPRPLGGNLGIHPALAVPGRDKGQ